VSDQDRQALDVIAQVQALLESTPGASEVLDDLRMGRVAPEDAMTRLAEAVMQGGQAEAMVKMSSQLSDLYGVTVATGDDGTPVMMKHDNGMNVVNPIMEAALKERASLDGDVPEGRVGAMLADATPAVPVITDSLDPVVVGYQLEQASKQVQQEIRRAIEDHDDVCTRLLSGATEGVPEEHQSTALEVAKKNLPPVPTGVRGYEAGKVAVPRKAVEAPVAVLAELNPIERRAYTHKALATTQGRVSLAPVIQKGVVEYLSQHSITARAGDPDPDSAVTTKWVMVVWGADDLSDGFNPITAAIHSMCSDVMEFIDGYSDVVVRVAPYHGIADRRFGWTLVASPKERTT
jgi:hypothetical protein